MDCEKIRGQFSLLSEGELKPEEEEEVKEHLAFCVDCQKEWETFNRMMGWLHTVEEEEVPEGFLAEIEQKLKERQEKVKRGRIWSLRTVKISLQAAAMVLIVLFALYLTQMGPFEMLPKRVVEKRETLPPDREKQEVRLKEEEQKGAPAPPGVGRKDALSETKASIAEGKVGEKGRVVHTMKEERKALTIPSKKESATSEPIFKKEVEKVETPVLEKKEAGVKPPAGAIIPLAREPIQEISLKTTDQERAYLDLQEVVKQFGGEVVREKSDVLMATLPSSAFKEFEREVRRMSLSPISPQAVLQKEMKDDLEFAVSEKAKRIEVKKREAFKSEGPMEDTITIRIRLVPE